MVLPMKIVYLSSSKIPSLTANSIHVMKMCQAFASKGHSVKLICIDGKKKVDDEYDFYGVERCFEIIKLRRPKGRVGNFVYGLRIRHLLKNGHSLPDIFYARNIYGLAFIANTGIPLIYEAHSIPGSMRSLLENWLLSRTNFARLVVISNVLKSKYLELFGFLDEKMIRVAHDAADLPLNYSDNIINLDDKKVNVGYFGSLYTGRGLGLISELVRRLPYINFHIIGGLPNNVSIWKSKLDHYSNVFLYGFMPHPEAEKYRQAMDILIAPYQETVVTSEWMSPLKIFEYMAAGKAIVCSDFPVLREVLSDGINALLVSPRDVDQWYEALIKLSADSALRHKLSTNARKKVEKYFTWTIRAARVLDGCHL